MLQSTEEGNNFVSRELQFAAQGRYIYPHSHTFTAESAECFCQLAADWWSVISLRGNTEEGDGRLEELWRDVKTKPSAYKSALTQKVIGCSNDRGGECDKEGGRRAPNSRLMWSRSCGGHEKLRRSFVLLSAATQLSLQSAFVLGCR
ncbi:hypothetical protein PAMP_008619 [Pampus punctatissimus]